MKFKIILLALLASLNLCAYEPLTPGKASEKKLVMIMSKLMAVFHLMETT